MNSVLNYINDVNYCDKKENERINKNIAYYGKKALVGDYNEGTSEMTKNILEKLGIIVNIVSTGDEIVEKIKQGEKYDIIFTNYIYKKGENGITTLRYLKEIKGFNIPVIIHSSSESEKEFFIDIYGFDDYIEKPLNMKDVTTILNKFFN